MKSRHTRWKKCPTPNTEYRFVLEPGSSRWITEFRSTAKTVKVKLNKYVVILPEGKIWHVQSPNAEAAAHIFTQALGFKGGLERKDIEVREDSEETHKE